VKLSTKGRYAVVALCDLALAAGNAGAGTEALVEAMRGPGGGYRLARVASDIRMSDIMEAVEENVSAMHSGAGASGGVSGSRAQSLSNRLWEGLSAQVYVFLHQTRLSDVIRNEMKPCPAVPALFAVVDED
jgi:Rrf2 family transcriptional regulator, iron-sulfur cluster assembly transcription factor